MANVDASTCCICSKEISPKQRRVIHSPAFLVFQQLQEVLKRVISEDDKYVCTVCFAKLNRISKIDYDILNRIDALRKEKADILQTLRVSQKRQIIHSPTPRKLKKATVCQPLRSPSGSSSKSPALLSSRSLACRALYSPSKSPASKLPSSSLSCRPIVSQVLRTPSKSTSQQSSTSDTPKTTKRKRLFFRDPPIDSVRVSKIKRKERNPTQLETKDVLYVMWIVHRF